MSINKSKAMTRQRRWQLKMKEQKRCQVCGKQMKVFRSKCTDCSPKYYKRCRIPSIKPIDEAQSNGWGKNDEPKLASGAELLSRLTIPEQYETNEIR